jgi:hypothetical protein
MGGLLVALEPRAPDEHPIIASIDPALITLEGQTKRRKARTPR